jgi:hypothetical protein
MGAFKGAEETGIDKKRKMKRDGLTKPSMVIRM